MTLKNILLLLTFGCSLSVYAGENTTTTSTLQDVATQWHQALKQDVYWEVPYGVKANIPANTTMTTEDFLQSITALNRRAVKERPELAPLQVCVFSNALVVRSLDQPDCGKKLNAK